MTGSKLAELMIDTNMKCAVADVARRYTNCIEDQEEYIQDAWLYIADKCHDDASDAGLEKAALRGIRNAYQRKRYRVAKKPPEKSNSKGEGQKKISVPRGAVGLGRGRHILPKREKLDSWYYDGEWVACDSKYEGWMDEFPGEYDDHGGRVAWFYKIVVST